MYSVRPPKFPATLFGRKICTLLNLAVIITMKPVCASKAVDTRAPDLGDWGS